MYFFLYPLLILHGQKTVAASVPAEIPFTEFIRIFFRFRFVKENIQRFFYEFAFGFIFLLCQRYQFLLVFYR